MAKYREKSPEDLAWNRTRRRLTRDLDTQLQDFREELLNKVLTHAFAEHVRALETGEVIHLEDDASAWVRSVVDEKLRPALEATVGDMAHG